MTWLRHSLVCVCVAACSTTVLAHPGHGITAPESPAHYIVEPVHLGVIVVAVIVAMATTAWIVRSRKKHVRDEASRSAQ